jgi:hypothetical protein
MKSLLCGEQIRETIPVQTKYGRCTLYFTNFAITLESASKGLVLELEHESVLSFQPIDKKSLRLIWSESNSTYELTINYEKPEYLTNKFKEIQNNHINSLKIAGIKIEEHTTEQGIIKSEVELSRFKKIPKEIPDDAIWNDCWYNKNLNLYITHNKFFKEIEQLRNRQHQINYQINTNDDGIVVFSDKVVTKFGIPAIKMPNDGKMNWFLLPTMNEMLLNNDIKNARFYQDPEKRIDYSETK